MLTSSAILKKGDRLVGPPELRQRQHSITTVVGGKRQFETGLNGMCLPIELTDWLLVDVAFLLIGLTKISLKNLVLTTHL
jgi:hypothetical protein